MTADPGLFSLNAGEVSRRALGRVDLAKLRVACEVQKNFLPHVLGPTMLRPGTGLTTGVPGDLPGWLGEFYFSETAKALFVLTAGGLAFLVNGFFVQRPVVSAAVTNGDFTSDISAWIDSDEPGAVSSWEAGLAKLLGTGTNYALLDQEITVVETGTEHALRVVVIRNNVLLQIGATQGDDLYFSGTLGAGTYSIAFTPSANFWIRIGANSEYPAYVESVTIELSGIVSLPVPYSTKEHFDALRYDQSADVVFVAGAGFQQRRIERRSSDSRSWGVALYQADDGPFRLSNVGSTTIAPSSYSGIVNLIASRSLFDQGHVGALFKLTHSKQHRVSVLAAVNDATGNIRVTGLTAHAASGSTPAIATNRAFNLDVSGTFVGTIQLQKSLAEPGDWADVSGESYTAPTSKTIDDALDNQIVFYRLICTAYTSGSALAVLDYAGASQDGIARIVSVTNSVTAAADVLQQFGGTAPTSDWAESEWSGYRGWPSAVALDDGRLDWFSDLKAQLSVSDAYASFDAEVVGDSGPINRTITTGGADGARWALSLSRLIVGTASQIVSIQASSFDEPLTPTAFTARLCSTQGAAAVRALKVDTAGVFVGRDGARVFELLYDVQAASYRSQELTRLKQEMCAAGVADVAVQRNPDTRLWFVLKDGTCAVLTYEQDDEVVAWNPVVTDGAFERVAVLPGTVEDDVYFIVRRTVDAANRRYIERLAYRSECQGGALDKAGIDSHVVYTGVPTSVVSGLAHLEGKTVVVWGDGAAVIGEFVVVGGSITLPSAVSNAVVGLPFTGQIKLAKLAFPTEHGTGLTAQKRVSRLGIVMADTSWGGVRIGRDFNNLTSLPSTYRGKPLIGGQVLESYDAKVPFNGGWDSDSRVCIQVSGPHCCTIMGIVPHLEINEPSEPVPAPRASR